MGALGSLPGIGDLMAHSFVAAAIIAGTAIAFVAGLAGYFLVLRGQVFTGDVLGHVAFTGAAAALAFGLDARAGLFAATIGLGMVMGLLGERGRADDVVIGNVLSWVLGLGVFFLTLFITSHSAVAGTAGIAVLFGSIYGLGAAQAWTATAVAVVVSGLLLLIARPLLFATVDGTVAAARGVPVKALGVVFLALVGVAAAEATQAVGALLLLGLLAAPAGTAHRLTSRPYAGLLASAGIAVFDMWAGLALSFFAPVLPPSFAIIAVATAVYAFAFAATSLSGRQRRAAGAAFLAGTLLLFALAGCSAKAKPSVVGTWRAADTAGKRGSLSDLTLQSDGHFYYGGKNALGVSVRFGGTYRLGQQNGAPWIGLVYDDFPSRQTVWFYKVDDTQLTVSTVQGNLTNGSALVFTRQ